MTKTPQIYVACLASYNDGILFGQWIDANQDADAICDDIAALLRRSPCPNVTVDCLGCDGHGKWHEKSEDCPACKGTGKVPSAEEWAIHDYDNLAGMGQNPDLAKASLQAQMTEKHGDAWQAYCNHVGTNYATEEGFDDSYRGTYRTAEDWAEELLNDCGDLESIPANLRNYFDFERYARDMECAGWYFPRGVAGVLVFSPG